MTMADDRADRLSPPGRMNQRLARLGFVDPDRAAAVLAGPPLSWWDSEASAPASPGAAAVIAALGRASDPDLAVNALADLAGRWWETTSNCCGPHSRRAARCAPA